MLDSDGSSVTDCDQHSFFFLKKKRLFVQAFRIAHTHYHAAFSASHSSSVIFGFLKNQYNKKDCFSPALKLCSVCLYFQTTLCPLPHGQACAGTVPENCSFIQQMLNRCQMNSSNCAATKDAHAF